MRCELVAYSEQRRFRLGACVLMLGAVLSLPVGVMAQTATPMLAGGGGHSLALQSNGTVKVWGDNNLGQLGLALSPSPSIFAPVQIPTSSLNNVVAVASGQVSSFALLSNGTVKAWGANNNGQLGLGHTSVQNTPQQIPSTSLNNVVAIAAGWCHSLALLSNGTVKSWGCNQGGELGLGYAGIATFQTVPQQILASNLSNVVAIAAGSNHSLALLANGTVKSWGVNQHGELGLGFSGLATSQSTPQQVPASRLSNVVAIAAGGAHNLALLSNGKVMVWGWNGGGQLGLGHQVSQPTPQVLFTGSMSPVVAMSAGGTHTLLLFADGTVMVSGLDNHGQLGLGFVSFPFFVTTPVQIPSASLSNVTSLEAGGDHSFALLSNGTVKAWGANSGGRLGLGYSSFSGVPTPQFIHGHCFTGGNSYTMQFGPLGNYAIGMTVPCNTVTSVASGYQYFNAFSANPLNAISPGTGSWHGLHTTQTEVLSWLNWGASGLTLALGPLVSSGGAVATAAIAPSSLSGLTVYGVSVAFHPFTFAVVASSPVTSHTF